MNKKLQITIVALSNRSSEEKSSSHIVNKALAARLSAHRYSEHHH